MNRMTIHPMCASLLVSYYECYTPRRSVVSERKYALRWWCGWWWRFLFLLVNLRQPESLERTKEYQIDCFSWFVIVFPKQIIDTTTTVINTLKAFKTRGPHIQTLQLTFSNDKINLLHISWPNCFVRVKFSIKTSAYMQVITVCVLTILLHAVASIMYLGLNCTHCTGPVWSPARTASFKPVSVFQQWILLSVEPTTHNRLI